MARKKKTRASRKWVYGNRIIIPRKKTSELNKLDQIPYKDVELLKNYITERGRIIPRRITGNTAGTRLFLSGHARSSLLYRPRAGS